MRKAKKIAIGIGIAIVVIFFANMGYATYFVTENLVFRITSESMAPTLEVDDMIVADDSVPFDSLEIGDIIVFDRPSDHERVIVMRIVDISTDSQGERTITTKGDANPSSIPGTDFPITKEEYIGKVSQIIES